MERNEELTEKAKHLTKDDLNKMRVNSKQSFSDDALIKQWKINQIPKYGRRARTKPILERKNHKKFECLCDIDKSFSRHYIPHFGGGIKRENEELLTPHFIAYWKNIREGVTGTYESYLKKKKGFISFLISGFRNRRMERSL